ncbi:MAG: hypothetical protein AAF797_00145 [Planctomycetota bacterium]
MSRDRIIQLVALTLVVGSLVFSSFLIENISVERRELQLAADTDVGENIPPEYALLAQLGSFRGIAVNALWYQLEMQKRDGKYFEANTLSQLITKLQPRFPQVWAFTAWNMAYNISVKAQTPKERWDWVNKGISLLREEGIPQNPNAIRLYRELGWILFHKVGGQTDDMHHYYKAEIAREWHTKLGGDIDRMRARDYIAQFQRLADFTDNYFVSGSTGLLVGTPSSETFTRFRNDFPQASRLIAELQELGYAPDTRTLLALGGVFMLRDGYDWSVIEALDNDQLSDDARALIPYLKQREQDRRQRITAVQRRAQQQGLTGQQFMQLIRTPRDQITSPTLAELRDNWSSAIADPLRTELLPFLRARTLVEQDRMDPRFMHRLMQDFGPVDWRSPFGHSLYWYAKGVDKAYDKRDRTKIDQINTDRGIIHSLQGLFRFGTLSFDPLAGPQGRGSVTSQPNIAFIAAYETAMQNARDRAADVDWGVANDTSYEAGHENFLHDAIRAAYFYGNQFDPDLPTARELYDRVRKLYWNRGEGFQVTYQDRYELPLDEFVLALLIEDQMMKQVPTTVITSLIHRGFFEGWGRNRRDVFTRFYSMAEAVHKKAQEERSGGDNPNAQVSRRQLPPLERMTTDYYFQFMTNPVLPLLTRQRVFRNSPVSIQLTTYDAMATPLRAQAEAQGMSFDNLFPPPQGLAQFRAELRARQQAAEEAGPASAVERQ